MSCNQWKELLIGLLYDELSPEDRQRVSDHLASCPRCTGTLDRLDEARALLRETEPAVPAAPRVLVMRPPRKRWMVGFAAGFLVAALLLGAGTAAGFYLARPGDDLAGRVGTHAETLDTVTRTLEDQRMMIETLGQQPTPGSTALTQEQFVAGLRALAGEIEQKRASDLKFLYDDLLREIAGVQHRTDQRIGQTEEALQYVVLAASNPKILAQ